MNDLGPGPITGGASVTTPRAPATGTTACGSAAAAAPGQLALPGNRYSLVGLPGGTTLGSGAALYSWFDQGAGTTYGGHPGAEPVAAGRGYWSWALCPRLVDLTAGSPSAEFPLGAYHASMVGNPSATRSAVVTGHDFGAMWDNATQSYRVSGYREPQTLAVGQGAWVFAFGATQITIEAAR